MTVRSSFPIETGSQLEISNHVHYLINTGDRGQPGTRDRVSFKEIVTFFVTIVTQN